MNIEIGQILTQIISFLVMLWVLRRYAWGPLLAIMEERRQRIKDEFKAIDNEKKELNSLKKNYQAQLDGIQDEARKKIQEAIKQSEKISADIQNEANIQAKTILSKTKEDLQNEIAKAKIQLRDELVNLTLLSTQKLIQMNLNEEGQKKLIKKFIDHPEL